MIELHSGAASEDSPGVGKVSQHTDDADAVALDDVLVMDDVRGDGIPRVFGEAVLQLR